tara:strand:- start:4 stop:735 length:732 start_codon:yes stop_codon:yes gene_type:complete
MEILGIVFGALVIFLLLRTKYVRNILIHWLNYVKNAGTTGSIVFVIGSIILSLIINNCTISNIASGFLYGFKEGTIFNIIIVYIIAIVAYFIGNKLIRKEVEDKLNKEAIFKPLKEIKDNKDKLSPNDKIEFVALSRLPPVYPFQYLSYFWGITNVKLSYYLIGTLGVIPSVCLETYFGSLMENVEEIFSRGASKKETHHVKIMVATIVISVLITIFIGYLAKKTIDKRVKEFNHKSKKKSKE